MMAVAKEPVPSQALSFRATGLEGSGWAGVASGAPKSWDAGPVLGGYDMGDGWTKEVGANFARMPHDAYGCEVSSDRGSADGRRHLRASGGAIVITGKY